MPDPGSQRGGGGVSGGGGRSGQSGPRGAGRSPAADHAEVGGRGPARGSGQSGPRGRGISPAQQGRAPRGRSGERTGPLGFTSTEVFGAFVKGLGTLAGPIGLGMAAIGAIQDLTGDKGSPPSFGPEHGPGAHRQVAQSVATNEPIVQNPPIQPATDLTAALTGDVASLEGAVSEQVRRRAAAVARHAQGRPSTILTGGLGLTSPASTAPRTILGV